MTDRNGDLSQAISPTITLIVVAIVNFVISFMASSVNVALPAIGRDLRASAVQLGLTVTIFVLANASFLLPMGRFADIYGRRRIFITGMVIMALSTLSLGLIHSMAGFLLLRFFQGAGMGMALTTSLAIFTAVFPPQHRGRGMGIIVAMVYIGMSLGPSLSGFIVNFLGWRWVFILVFGLIAAALLLTLIRLKGEWANAAGEPFDYVGTGVFIVSLCLIVFGASRLTTSPTGKWVFITGMFGMIIFGMIEWKAHYPLLDLRLLLNNLGFTFSNLATFLNYASIMVFIFFIALYLQYVKGFSPQKAGMLLIVQPVVQALLAPMAGRLADIYPPSIIATIGMGFCTVGLTASAMINPDTSFTYIVVVMILLGMSLGLFSSPNMTAIMNSVGPEHHGTASSMVATMRITGMLFSATAIAVILSIYLGDAPVNSGNIPQFVASMQTSLYLFSFLSFLGVIFSMVKGRLAMSMSHNPPA